MISKMFQCIILNLDNLFFSEFLSPISLIILIDYPFLLFKISIPNKYRGKTKKYSYFQIIDIPMVGA